MIPEWVLRKFNFKPKKVWPYKVLVWKEPAKEWTVVDYFKNYLKNKFPGYEFEIKVAGEHAEVWCCSNCEIPTSLVYHIRRSI